MTIRLPRPVIRGLGAVVFLAVFLAAARLIGPISSRATPADLGAASGVQPAIGPNTRTRELPALIGSLVGAEYGLDIFITRDGLRYTVKDAQGHTLAESITDAEVYERFPALDLSTMHAGAESESIFVPEE
ncbi:MAG TPA: hypothetical protein DEB06_04230 [Phycisphaerales bacterium]|nr:hypothetical protein [Phycisphaerales bacterium]